MRLSGPSSQHMPGPGDKASIRPGVTDPLETFSQAERWGFKLQPTALSQKIKDYEFWSQASGGGRLAGLGWC